MKIGFILPSCPPSPSGGAKVVYEYANYLAKENDVTIYFMMDRFMKRRKLPQFTKRLIAKSVVYTQPGWFPLSKKIQKKIVYDKDDVDELQVIIATALSTAKLLNQIKSSVTKKFYFIQDFENWECSDKEVFETYSYDMTKITIAKWLERIINVYSSTPAYYVSNSINLQTFYVQKEPDKRKKYSITFHYRQSPIKGCKYAIDTIKRLKIIYSELEVNVISVEKRPENMPEYCRYYYNLKPDEVAAVLNKTRVFICTSICEGFGLPGLEAMACGCALASTEFQGALEYAVHQKNCLLSPIENSDAMVENVIKLFEDDDLYREIVHGGIETAAARSIEKSAEKFSEIIINSLERQ